MKTKSLEKLENFQLKIENLNKIIGGEGKPVKQFTSVDTGTFTEGGTTSHISGDANICHSYSSDCFYSDGSYQYFNVNLVK